MDLAWELKKPWNMKLTMIPIVIGTLGSVTKALVQSLEGLKITRGVETTRTTALLWLARILRRVLETWGDLLSLKYQWKTVGISWFEKLSRSKIIIIIIIIITQHIFKESKLRWKKLAMVWIDYWKVYDMVLQSWIIECLKMYKMLDKDIKFIEETMTH